MTYTAVAKDITVLGQQFQSFLNEAGQVVFSIVSAARGLDKPETSFRRLRASKQLKALLGKAPETSTLKTNVSPRSISVVTMTELTQMVNILAEQGDDRAISMQQASFALMLQQSVDVAYGTKRESEEYTSKASELAKVIEEERQSLRRFSGSITNPTIACNLYTFNNDLVYGTGNTRDTYEGSDRDRKHTQMEAMEMIQAGMKMGGCDLEAIKQLSPNLFNTKVSKLGSK